MAAAGAVALAWVLGAQSRGTPWLSIEPVFPGLAVAAVFGAAGIAARRIRSRFEA
jgi:hypothetical protein